jgi:endonuclease/exonuclease/phosphatase family metal-dependent hydrolase
MIDPIRVVTWNIGQGIDSIPDLHDKGSEDVTGFLLRNLNEKVANALREVSADFVCLQEVHFLGNIYSQTKEIADLAGYEYYSDFSLDNSHHFLTEGLRLGVSVLAKHKIIDTQLHMLMNPDIKTQQENRKIWHTHDKGFIVVKSNLVGIGNVNVISIHLLPFHRFNLNATDNRVLSVWRELDAELSFYADRRTLICGDFNQNNLSSLLPILFNNYGFKDTCFDKPTHRDVFFDHIVVSADFNVLRSKVADIYNYSDHYLCIAEVLPRS